VCRPLDASLIYINESSPHNKRRTLHSIQNLIFAVAEVLMVDKLGRRKLFLLSFAIMFTSYICITALSGSFAEPGQRSVGLAVTPFLHTFFAGHDMAV
jgi:hypothetical protein